MFSSKHGPLMFLARTALFLVIFVAAAEVMLRTVIPAAEHPAYFQDREWNIMKFDSTGQTVGLQTDGRLGIVAGQWRVNNDGWLSPIDYLPPSQRDRLLIALLGDSFIAAYHSDAQDHVDPYLSDALSPAVDVYAFGKAGGYLEQYFALSRYVTATYAPDLFVVFMGRGDVADSLRENGVISPYMWQIETSGGRFVEVSPQKTYVPSRAIRWAQLSALARYLRYNVKITLPGMQASVIAGETDTDGPAADDEPVLEDDTDWQSLLPAARHMLNAFSANNPGVPIIFATRGSPADWYLAVDELAVKPPSADDLAVMAACDEYPNCHYLDLRPAFSRDWAANHESFVAPDDYHWNAYANRLVAETLADFIQTNALLVNKSSADL